MMKYIHFLTGKTAALLLTGALLLCGCSRTPVEQAAAGQAPSGPASSAAEGQPMPAADAPSAVPGTPGQPASTAQAPSEEASADTQPVPAAPSAEAGPDAGQFSTGAAFIGEYLDPDVGEPGLEIAPQEGGGYLVQLRIYRLASLSDGQGEWTGEGIAFTATDPSGSPIRGLITAEGQTAIVTFTDSSWDGLPAGSVFRYTKSSDTPVL